MNICDLKLLSEICPNLDYYDLILGCCIRNSLCKFKYMEKEIFFTLGRNFAILTEFLDKLNISYTDISFETLINLKDFNDIIILFPKQILDLDINKISSLNNIFIVYSAFKIYSIDKLNQIIYFCLEGNNTNFNNKINFKDFEKLCSTNSVPFEKVIKIIKIKDIEYNLDKRIILNLMIENMNFNINNCNYNCNYYNVTTGIQFYDLFKEKLYHLSLKKNDSSENKIKYHLFISSLRSGTFDFFRSEFSNALKNTNYLDEQTIGILNKLLREVSNLYIKILQSERKFQCSYSNLDINNIKQIEITIFNKILEKVNGIYNDF